MIKFNLYNISNGNEKVRVSYSLDNNKTHSPEVSIHAKDYGCQLRKLFADATNDTEIISDYIVVDRMTLTPESPFYAEARKAAEAIAAKYAKMYAR